MLISAFPIKGTSRYEGMDFSGNMYVQTSSDDDFIGFAFAYQGQRQFYLVSWKQTSQGYWRRYKGHSLDATAGIEIKVCMRDKGRARERKKERKGEKALTAGFQF